MIEKKLILLSLSKTILLPLLYHEYVDMTLKKKFVNSLIWYDSPALWLKKRQTYFL
jgi:hypothetical protein